MAINIQIHIHNERVSPYQVCPPHITAVWSLQTAIPKPEKVSLSLIRVQFKAWNSIFPLFFVAYLGGNLVCMCERTTLLGD